MIVRLLPKTKRMKQRVAQHGETFSVLREDGEKTLVKSQEKTAFNGCHWMAWITREDAEIKKL